MIRRPAAAAAVLSAVLAACLTAIAAQFSLALAAAAVSATLAAGFVLAIHVVSRRVEGGIERLEARLTLDQLQRGTNDWRLTNPYAATPDLIWIVAEEILQRKASVVLELGAGVSTLVLARIIRSQQCDCRLVSVEHDPAYASRIRDELRSEGLDDVATVFDAPLEHVSTDGYSGPWYRRSAWLESLEPVNILLVDGPPKRFHPAIRSAAVPLLAERLAPGALIVLDDASRKPERRALSNWNRLLPGSTAQYRDVGRGIGVIRCAAGESL